MSDLELSAKRILMIGTTGILGTEFSKALSSKGAKIVLADKPGSDVFSLADSLGVSAVEIDIASENSVISGVKEATATLGGIDAAINNAAATFESFIGSGDAFADFENYPLKVWLKTIDVNLTGAFLFARETGKIMKHSGGGNLINISSVYGVVAPDHSIYSGQPFKSMPGYAASKAGIIGLSKWLATLWAQNEIRVNCISPGGVYNEHNESFAKAYGKRTPMGRMAKREEMIGILMFLLSDASSYCTGQNFIIDGGLTAW